jgi:dodecin
MPERTYKLIELVGVSEISTEEAIRNALARASQSLKGLDWFEVTEVRGLIHEGKVSRGLVIIHQAAFKRGLRPTRRSWLCSKRCCNASW